MKIIFHLIRPKLTLTKIFKKYCRRFESPRLKILARNKLRKLCVDKELITSSKYNFSMFANPSDYASFGIYFFGDYDEIMSQILRAYIKEGEVVFDLGTERGWFTLLMGMLVGQNGKVHSFEAYPPNYEKLIKNISLNQMNWIKPKNIGLSNKSGKMWFVPPSNEITHNISYLDNCGGIGYITDKYKNECIEISVTSLDEYVKDQGVTNIRFIKIDIEGEEYNTLLGAKNTIETYRPILAVEYNRSTALRASSSVEDLDLLLEEYKYNRYYFWNGFKNFELNKFNDPELVINVYCFPR